MAWRTTPDLGPTGWQASDVARGAALCLTLYKVEALLAVLCESLLVTDMVLSPAW